MLTKVLGIDLQTVFLTMLALVGLYLILTHWRALNAIIGTTIHGANDSLIILQGRTTGFTSGGVPSGKPVLPKGY